jgi:outer membrane protein assembly factor BamB
MRCGSSLKSLVTLSALALVSTGCSKLTPPPTTAKTPAELRPAINVETGTLPKVSRNAELEPAPSAEPTPPVQNNIRHTSFNAAPEVNWPAFRGPSGMGVSDSKGLPTTWSLEGNIAWKVPLPGPGASSPIVFGDRIYITAYSGFFVPGEPGGNQEDLKRHLLALKRTDGSLIWEQKVAARLPEENSIRDHGFAASTAAADIERVYVFFGKTGVIAFNHEGNELWRKEVGSDTSDWGSSASPVLYKDLVFINASVESESLYALDRKTGDVKWQQKKIIQSWNTPVLVKAESGRMELIVAVQGKVLAFDPDSGDPLWNCDTDIKWYMVPSVVAADGIVYCLGGRSGNAGLAVRTGGSGDVTDTHRLWISQNGSNVTSPIYLDKHLYWMHESGGIAYCAKAETGEVVYKERMPRAGQVYASALLAEGKIYYLTRDGKTYVVAAKPEFELLATNELRDRSIFNGSPAVDGSRLLIRSDKFLYCIGK